MALMLVVATVATAATAFAGSGSTCGRAMSRATTMPACAQVFRQVAAANNTVALAMLHAKLRPPPFRANRLGVLQPTMMPRR